MKTIWLSVILIIVTSLSANAQAVEKIKEIIDETTGTELITTPPPVDSIAILKKVMSEKLLDEQNLLMEVERLRSTLDSSSVSKKRSRLVIDSLRNIVKGVPVVLDTDTILLIYGSIGATNPTQRAENITHILDRISTEYSLQPDSIAVKIVDSVYEIMYKDRVIASVTEQDAMWEGKNQIEVANKWRESIVKEMHILKAENSLMKLLLRILMFIGVIVGQVLLFKLIGYLFSKFKNRILSSKRLRAIKIQDYDLLSTEFEKRILVLVANLLKYFFCIVVVILTIPLLFAIFPKTEELAYVILGYILNPLKSIGAAIVSYVPNLFVIVIVVIMINYLVKLFNYLAGEIDAEKLKIKGFYHDWAYPTFNIVRFLLYIFMIAIIYPYLPGASSGVFQGISVFIGLIISLGSSTVIANIIAGLVITYMRPFKIGDRIKLNDTTGNVIEKTPFVTRVRTPKNEVITIPNSFIMSSHTTNYSASARDYGLIIHSEVTIGYDVPWRKVHQLLVDAALLTDGIEALPEPFVLETSLNDWYPVYQINAYTKNADDMAKIYSRLHQNIQDCFDRADVEILSPQYIATRDGNKSTVVKPENRE